MDENKIHLLMDLRSNIHSCLLSIESILKTNSPEHYDHAYQHWIPQIMTALFDDTKWLPRGEYSMEYTLKHLLDNVECKGISKYLN